MKVTFAGTLDELVPAHRQKIERKLSKLGKFVDGKEENSAHVIVGHEGQFRKAEITLHVHEHDLVATATAPDLLTAMSAAIEKLEKQLLKLRERRRDSKRGPDKSIRIYAAPGAAEEEAPADEGEFAVAEMEDGRQVKIFRADDRLNHKPLTLEEAVLQMEQDGLDYFVFRDLETDRICVLMRRPDGNLDLARL